MLTRRATLAGIAALGFPSAADAQGFPSRSITIIVPYPPGGPVDALARLIAQEAAGDLNQPIVVENRPGGSGIIGTQAVARAEPDGYVLVLGTNQTHATNQSLIKNCPYDAVKDFAPVAGIAAMPHVLVVRKSLVLRSVGDVVAMAKAKPGSLTFGSTGNGSGAHLAGELFKTKAGIDMLHVPFKGLSPMLTELLADRIDLSIAPLPGLIGQQIESGAVRALGLARAERVPQLMSVPTFAESGVPGVEADAWSALFAPARTPAPVIERLPHHRHGAVEGFSTRDNGQTRHSRGAQDTDGDRRHAPRRSGEMGRGDQGGQSGNGLSNRLRTTSPMIRPRQAVRKNARHCAKESSLCRPLKSQVRSRCRCAPWDRSALVRNRYRTSRGRRRTPIPLHAHAGARTPWYRRTASRGSRLGGTCSG